MTRNERRKASAARVVKKQERVVARLVSEGLEHNRKIVAANKTVERNYYPQSQWATLPMQQGMARKPGLKRQLEVMFLERSHGKAHGATPKG